MKVLNKITCPSNSNRGGSVSLPSISIDKDGKIIITKSALALLNLNVNDKFEIVEDEGLYLIKSAQKKNAWRVGVKGSSSTVGLRQYLNTLLKLNPKLNYKWEISPTETKTWLDGQLTGYLLFNHKPINKK